MFISAQDAHFYSDIMLGSFNDFKEIVIGEIFMLCLWVIIIQELRFQKGQTKKSVIL
nr:MAG TPA: hypothetical protein [Caudoviricetes sp.]